MALTVNLSQINSAANGNANDLRESLTSLHLAVQSLYAQTGATPLQKVDANTPKYLAAPAQCGFRMVGANGVFTYSITLPQQSSGSSAPGNPTNAPLFQEISSSPAADFSSAVTTYPPTTSTSGTFANPGATLYWRLRSSYNQTTYNQFFVFPGAVSAGLQSSAATEPNNPLNQSNFATIDSVAAGGAATVRVYGSGGPGSSWTSILGNNSKVIPGGTIMNIAYGTDGYVAWSGSSYQFKAGLTLTFPDSWIPVGKVSTISNGAGLMLPTVTLVVSSGSVVAATITNKGNGLTAVPTFTITDSSGSGAAIVGTVSGGFLTGVTITNAGNGLYTSSPVVTASGGVAGGVGGGGGPAGSNSGRIYSTAANGS